MCWERTTTWLQSSFAMPVTSGRQADFYSLGCTLYHLLASRVPFLATSKHDKIEAHRSKQADPLGDLHPMFLRSSRQSWLA